MVIILRAFFCLLLCAVCAAAAPSRQLSPGSGWLVQGGSYPSQLWKTPVRVLLAGDSLMESLGPQMRRSLAGYSNITFIPIGKKSTGLSRSDYYDWPAVLKRHLVQDRPHVVVMWVGTNDPQGIYGLKGLGEPCSDAWLQAYRDKVREVITLSHRHGARFMLMGPPVVGDAKLNAQLGRIDRLMGEVCKAMGICYISTRLILGGAGGIFRPQGRLLNGQMVTLRTADRVHITADGNRRVMDYMLPYLAHEIESCFRPVSTTGRTPRQGSSGSAAVIRPASSSPAGQGGSRR